LEVRPHISPDLLNVPATMEHISIFVQLLPDLPAKVEAAGEY
jgi:hypothetical protein